MRPEPSQVPGVHPQEEALRETLARLRASLSALLLQKDELLLIQCKRVETAYLRRFGALEIKLYESWCDCLRVKKKAKLIRARRNRRELVDMAQIESVLNGELKTYREQLEQRAQYVAGALEKRGRLGLSSQGAKELKDLYRQAVKALHPDLHPDEEQSRAQILQQAMRAYRNGDLEALRAICESIQPERSKELSGLEALQAEISRLRARLQAIDRELERIKADYPLNMRVYLEDEAQGRSHEAELMEKLRKIQERTARYEAEIVSLLTPKDWEGDVE